MDTIILTEKEKMIQGKIYNSSDEQLIKDRNHARQIIYKFNYSLNIDERKQLIKNLFGSCGDIICIEPTLKLDYGYNIHVGNNFHANFGVILLDVCPIRIGSGCLLGTNSQLITATHPLDPYERISGIVYGKPITIGDNCWIGAGAIVLPGVTLGNNVVVGAGSIVTKSFGDNVVVAGNPAKVLKILDVKNQKEK